ncbi:hypothetical protein CDAR_518821 [Caerostris darwini]|uniref:Uncharacterized protein n=1 Tax=Caerostris darwini TaxID=1538125 RepID=A0AAV4PPI3_9ARAC|nr:hypothetical protein CDAR_518821 [Caerostris darwini]
MTVRHSAMAAVNEHSYEIKSVELPRGNWTTWMRGYLPGECRTELRMFIHVGERWLDSRERVPLSETLERC